MMDMSDKDELAGEKSNCVRNFDSVNTHADWRISVSNPPVSHPLEENPISICHSFCSPSQMMDSFRQNLWHDAGGFNVQTDAGASSNANTIERHLEMGWSMAQFPADSGFIERAARFSFFGCGSFSEMMNHESSLGVPETVGLFLQDTEIASGSKLGSGGPIKVVKDRSNGSEDSQSSGHAKCGETTSKKRKRIGKDLEADQSHRAQQSGQEEEEEDKKQKDLKSPDSNGNKTNIGKQACDSLKDGYIHRRARRGQATNSHSLAERVRREKISERMKFLQDLVPGCDKVTGKAVMLDEIINYVQSLQRQIEFLSMKLSTVNPMLDFNIESLVAKHALQSSSAPTFPHNMSVLYHPPPPPSYLSQTGFMHPNLSSMSPLNGGLKRQETHGYEGDLHMNHGTGATTDREDTPGESKTPILPYLR